METLMIEILKITLKGIFRDRIFQGIMGLTVLMFCIPSAASLSMRQVTELSITLSLSLISFILLLLAIFLGSTSIWKDIERRYTFSVLSLPLSRTYYIIGRFTGMALFILLTAVTLGIVAVLVIKLSANIYPSDRPLAWDCILAAILFDALKYILLVAVALLFSAISTSFFLPVFGTICSFLAGSITQQVYEYVNSPLGLKTLGPAAKIPASAVYYLIPNFAGFDLKVNAVYGFGLDMNGMVITLGYFAIYTAIVLSIASILFEKREMM